MNRVIAGALVATAAALLVPATGLTQGQGRVQLSANPTTVVFGASTTITGDARGGGGENAPVRLQADPFPFDGQYVEAGAGTTDAQGRFTFRALPRQNTQYRAVVANRESENVLVQVRMRVSNRVSDSTPRRGQLVRFYGSATPAHDGANVRIERRGPNGAYVLVGRTTLRDAGDARSRYSRRIRVRSSGVYRVVVQTNDGDHIDGISRSRRLRTHG